MYKDHKGLGRLLMILTDPRLVMTYFVVTLVVQISKMIMKNY